MERLKRRRRKARNLIIKPSLTDSEDLPENVSYPRYSKTVFPLFSNFSDDEVIVSRRRQRYILGVKLSTSAPSFKGDHATSEYRSYDPPDQFQIQNLPVDCKIKIFSFLGNVEKGKCMRVCKEWHDILLSPSLWTSVLLWDFPLTCLISASHTRNANCYKCYKSRVHLFSLFLLDMKPKLKKLEFKFDIGEAEDGFLCLLRELMKNLNLQDLHHLEMNWKDTPVRPFWIEKEWVMYNANCSTLVGYQRRRGRIFTYAFDDLTSVAPHIRTLVLPFDWNVRCIKCLTRLKFLHTLVLEKYFVFQTIHQDNLDRLLQGLPNLQKLMLEIWIPSGPGMLLYHLSSKSVRHLDISQCRGFYPKSLDFPKLERLRIARAPWNGPLVFRDQIRFPCLYGILVKGTPNLKKINDHYLDSNWTTLCYPMLEEALKSICSCHRHKTSWAM